MFLMSAGCGFFAWITGKITQLLTDKSACESRFEEIMEEIDTFLDARSISRDLRKRIKDYYKVKYPAQKVFAENDLIESIEFPTLKLKIIVHLFQDVMEHVHLFRMCDDQVVLASELPCLHAHLEREKLNSKFLCAGPARHLFPPALYLSHAASRDYKGRYHARLHLHGALRRGPVDRPGE